MKRDLKQKKRDGETYIKTRFKTNKRDGTFLHWKQQIIVKNVQILGEVLDTWNDYATRIASLTAKKSCGGLDLVDRKILFLRKESFFVPEVCWHVNRWLGEGYVPYMIHVTGIYLPIHLVDFLKFSWYIFPSPTVFVGF